MSGSPNANHASGGGGLPVQRIDAGGGVKRTTSSGNLRSFFSGKMAGISTKKFPTGGLGKSSKKLGLGPVGEPASFKLKSKSALTPQTSDVDPPEVQAQQQQQEQIGQSESSGAAAGAAAGIGTSASNGGKMRKSRSLLSLSSLGNRSVASLSSSITSLASVIGGSDHNKKGKDSIDSLLGRRKWRRLARYLSTDRGKAQVLASSTSCALTAADCPADGTNALHRACAAGAPLEIIKSLCATCPDLAVEVDGRGRTALHVAALPRAEHGGVPLNVLFHLMAVHGGAVCARDKEGRLPLHLACWDALLDATKAQDDEDNNEEAGGSSAHDRRSRYGNGDNRGGNDVGGGGEQPKTFEEMFRVTASGKVRPGVVAALCDEAPYAVNEEDASGLVPAELLIMGDEGSLTTGRGNRAEVLNCLLKRSERRWRRKLSEERTSAIDSLEECCAEEQAATHHTNTANTSTVGGTASNNGGGGGDGRHGTATRADERYARWRERRTPPMRAAYEAHAEVAAARRRAARRRGHHRGDGEHDDDDAAAATHYDMAIDAFFGGGGYDEYDEEEDMDDAVVPFLDYDVPTGEVPSGHGRGGDGGDGHGEDGSGGALFPSIEIQADERARMERRVSDLSLPKDCYE